MKAKTESIEGNPNKASNRLKILSAFHYFDDRLDYNPNNGNNSSFFVKWIQRKK